MTMTPSGAATDATLASLKRLVIVKTAVILSGQSLSSAVDAIDRRICRLEFPASWTWSVPTAAITFQVSSDGVTYRDFFHQDGLEYAITRFTGSSPAGCAINLTPIADWVGVQYLKIRSGTSGLPVNQMADREITVVAC